MVLILNVSRNLPAVIKKRESYALLNHTFFFERLFPILVYVQLQKQNLFSFS
jgi:hypothetical protein